MKSSNQRVLARRLATPVMRDLTDRELDEVSGGNGEHDTLGDGGGCSVPGGSTVIVCGGENGGTVDCQD